MKSLFSRRALLGATTSVVTSFVLLSLAGCKPAAETGAANTSAPDSASNAAANSDEIVIGHYASLTGSEATFGKSADQGVKLALDEINAANPPLGKKLRVVTEDNASQNQQVPLVVRKLIDQNDVLVLIGEVASGRSLAAAPIAQERKVPMVSPASTNPAVTETGEYIFRTCFIDPFQGEVMAKFGRENLKATKAAILTDVASDYSKGLAEFFGKAWRAQGGQIVAQESYQSGDKDFSSQLTKIKATNPEVIFVPGYYTEVGNIAVQARRLGLQQTLLGGDGWDSSELIPSARKELQGSYFSNHYSPDSKDPKVQKFVAAYQKKFGEVPYGMAALGYDTAYIVADAIKRAGSADRAKVRDALAETKDFQGVTGTISMNEERNAVKPAVVLEIKGDEFEYVTTVSP